MNLKHALLALSASAALCNPAFAGDQVTYTYSGVVDSDTAHRGWIAFTGQFTFDRTAADEIADPDTGYYVMTHAPYGMNVVFDGSAAFSFDDVFDVGVSNNTFGIDQFSTWAYDTSSKDGLALLLRDSTNTAFASGALPLSPGGLTLGMFSLSKFTYDGSAGMLIGHLTGLSCSAGCDRTVVTAPVPEPQTWALMLGGLFAVGSIARRRAAAAK